MTTVWKPFRIGAGGQVLGLKMHSDGTFVCHADAFGAYLWDPNAANPGNAGGTGCWEQLCVLSAFPNDQTLFLTPFMGGTGAYEVAIAPSNSSVLYMVYIGNVWSSTNKGQTWLRSSFPANTINRGGTLGDPGLMKFNGPKLAVDPANADVAYVTLYNAGTFVTENGTTTNSWTQVTPIPANSAPTIQNGVLNGTDTVTSLTDTSMIYVGQAVTGTFIPDSTTILNIISSTSVQLSAAATGSGTEALTFHIASGVRPNSCAVAFDSPTNPNYATTGGKTNVIWVSSWGHGLYKSADAGATFNHVAGSSFYIWDLVVARDGTLWIVDDSNKLWRMKTSETVPVDVTPAGNPAWYVAADPADANHILAADGYGHISETTGGSTVTSGSGWNAVNQNAFFIADDVPYLTTLHGLPTANHGTSWIIFDTQVSGRIWGCVNQGVFYTDLPLPASPSNVQWTSRSSGIEELVARYILPIAGSNSVVCCSSDVGAIAKDASHPDVMATGQPWDQADDFLVGADWADASPADYSYVAVVADRENLNGSGQYSGYSTGYGAAGTWSLFGQALARPFSGSIAISSSNKSNLIRAQAGYGNILYSHNGGTNWTTITFPDVCNHNQEYITVTTAAADTSITVADASGLVTNGWISIPGGTSGAYQITGVVGNVVSITPAVGAIINANTVRILAYTGWGAATYLIRGSVAADRVLADTFYLTNLGADNNAHTGQGFYVTRDAGSTWTYTPNTSAPFVDTNGNGAAIKSVPGKAGHLFYSNGSNGSPESNYPDQPPNTNSYPTGGKFWFLQLNQGTNAVTWVDASTLTDIGGGNRQTIGDVWAFGFGAPAPGKSDPAIYIYGWVGNGASYPAAGTQPAVWQSIDYGQSWQNFSNAMYPTGWTDNVTVIAGDPNIYGRVYIGLGGSGYVYGEIPGSRIISPLMYRLGGLHS